ncbi:hypothetical protein P170DRAFT_469569 [Aspergillus steynii IBT 23096]|uniref:Uncharacterized protein n=1 Tax=Aspergillus steynii IBT 23096 TaxID=1392250 RepID=A0A2I2GMJ0_9EURO|nr:uncharacterized protein P170DRAFT_469569 [Aspergillus steynii IBT 23096]PLB54102.1 hypothetical protein P170DRAFT_469569 [Aspergillus steynii IBT 23096]
MQIRYFAADETQPYLNASVDDQFHFNILTKSDLEALGDIDVQSRERQKIFDHQSGSTYVVGDVVKLRIFRDGDIRSHDRDFYVLLSDHDHLESGLHAILTPFCFPSENEYSNGDQVAVIRVKPPTEEEKKKQEENEKRRREAAEERDRKRREQEKAQNQPTR